MLRVRNSIFDTDSDCSQLTDRSVVALATSLTKLRRIGLVKVSLVLSFPLT